MDSFVSYLALFPQTFNQVRFLPKHRYLVAEVVYSISICEAKADNQRYCSIDIGIDSLVEWVLLEMQASFPGSTKLLGGNW